MRKALLDVLRAFCHLFAVVTRLFLFDPARMTYATLLHVLGDKEKAARVIAEVERRYGTR